LLQSQRLNLFRFDFVRDTLIFVPMKQLYGLVFVTLLLLSCSPKQAQKTDIQASAESDKTALEDISASDLGAIGFEFPGKLSQASVFKLKDLDGKSISLADYRGKIVLLNFWATWCGPCKAEMPSIQTFYQKNKSSGIILLSVNIGETEDVVRNYIEDNGFTFPVLLDGDQKIALDYGIEGIPTTYLIGKGGHFLARLVSSFEWDSALFFDAIQPVL
jgi:thiol-disulfide isomerase/thioredoxin